MKDKRSETRLGWKSLMWPSMLAAVLVMTGCGDDADPEPVDDDPESTTTVAAADDEPDGADGASITIADFDFGDPISVGTGTTVTVRNDDGTAHTWTAVDGSFDSGSLDPGDSFEHTFDAAGELDFVCEIHQSMTGSITVT